MYISIYILNIYIYINIYSIVKNPVILYNIVSIIMCTNKHNFDKIYYRSKD